MRSISIYFHVLILFFTFFSYKLEASLPLSEIDSHHVVSNLLYKNLETPKMRLKESLAHANVLFSKRIHAKSRISAKSGGRFSETLIKWEDYTNTVVAPILESIRIKLDSHEKTIDTSSILADIWNYYILLEARNPLYSTILDFNALHKNAEQGLLYCVLMPLSLTEGEADVLSNIAAYEEVNIELFNTIQYICKLLGEQ